MPSTQNKQAAEQIDMVPRHVAIIMDGNGRWAQNQGKLRISGHKAGVKAVKKAVSFAVNNHIESLTLYAFSSENWRRPTPEVSGLMELFIWALESEVRSLHKHNVKLTVIGDTQRFSTLIQDRIQHAETLTSNNNGLRLNVAANYGGRWDIINSFQILMSKVDAGELESKHISEAQLAENLCLNDQPPVDLVIRTGGEQRISNFLIWQIAYAEFYFSSVLWPDFDELVFKGALDAFSHRERRFGGAAPGNN